MCVEQLILVLPYKILDLRYDSEIEPASHIEFGKASIERESYIAKLSCHKCGEIGLVAALGEAQCQ